MCVLSVRGMVGRGMVSRGILGRGRIRRGPGNHFRSQHVQVSNHNPPGGPLLRPLPGAQLRFIHYLHGYFAQGGEPMPGFANIFCQRAMKRKLIRLCGLECVSVL